VLWTGVELTPTLTEEQLTITSDVMSRFSSSSAKTNARTVANAHMAGAET
jgi:hypothetical protein